MTESKFMALAEDSLGEIESAFEKLATETDLDIECSRHGNVLEIEFVEQATKIIVNIQAPLQELWLAAKTGGYHFRWQNALWIDRRAGDELFMVLSKAASTTLGQAIAVAKV